MLEIWLAVALGLAFWSVAIADVTAVDELDMRRLSKPAWLAVVVLLPVVGALAWIRLGRGTWRSFPATPPNGYPPLGGGRITGTRPGR